MEVYEFYITLQQGPIMTTNGPIAKVVPISILVAVIQRLRLLFLRLFWTVTIPSEK